MLALSACVLLMASAHVSAGTLNADQLPKIMMTVAGASTEWDYSPPQSAYVPATDADGGYELSYVLNAYGVCDDRADVKVEELQFNPDPFVLNNILVTNTTASTQIFSVFVGLPTSFARRTSLAGTLERVSSMAARTAGRLPRWLRCQSIRPR